jgi:hypothetical protein
VRAAQKLLKNSVHVNTSMGDCDSIFFLCSIWPLATGEKVFAQWEVWLGTSKETVIIHLEMYRYSTFCIIFISDAGIECGTINSAGA